MGLVGTTHYSADRNCKTWSFWTLSHAMVLFFQPRVLLQQQYWKCTWFLWLSWYVVGTAHNGTVWSDWIRFSWVLSSILGHLVMVPQTTVMFISTPVLAFMILIPCRSYPMLVLLLFVCWIWLWGWRCRPIHFQALLVSLPACHFRPFGPLLSWKWSSWCPIAFFPQDRLPGQ